MIRSLLCRLGIHRWQIASEVYVPNNGADDPPPVDYECGGIDYHLHCADCSAEFVKACRGVWLPLSYPKVSGA